MAVVETEITRKAPYADGQLFGETGVYERIDGILTFAVHAFLPLRNQHETLRGTAGRRLPSVTRTGMNLRRKFVNRHAGWHPIDTCCQRMKKLLSMRAWSGTMPPDPMTDLLDNPEFGRSLEGGTSTWKRFTAN